MAAGVVLWPLFRVQPKWDVLARFQLAAKLAVYCIPTAPSQFVPITCAPYVLKPGLEFRACVREFFGGVVGAMKHKLAPQLMLRASIVRGFKWGGSADALHQIPKS